MLPWASLLSRSRSRSELVVRAARFVDPIVARVCGRAWVPVLISYLIRVRVDMYKIYERANGSRGWGKGRVNVLTSY